MCMMIDPSDKQQVIFYSLTALTTSHTIDVQEPVLGIKSSTTFVAVLLQSRLQLYDQSTLTLKHEFVDLLDSPVNDLAAFDIASIGVCYSTCTKIQSPPEELFHMDGDLSHFTTEVARGLASGVKKMGGFVSNMLYPEKDTMQDGTVMLKFFQGHSVIFKPHSHPVSLLVFSPTETMMCSVSTNGTTIYGWSLLDCLDPKIKSLPKCIFKLERGITTAIITDINISPDERYVTVTSSRGTTHVFEPEKTSEPLTRLCSRSSYQMVKNLMGSKSLDTAQVHFSTSIDEAISDEAFEDIEISERLVCCSFLKTDQQVQVFSWDRKRLGMHQLDKTPPIEFDLIREPNWPQVAYSIDPKQRYTQQDLLQRWPQMIEPLVLEPFKFWDHPRIRYKK
ncbi:hypothetical protein EDD86DRAFT_150337 [Gorgonomyces haynaldii]|nr:hypothetical protein EDD86DRAFT_150337 [Gorgonomyces haynaldii]